MFRLAHLVAYDPVNSTFAYVETDMFSVLLFLPKCSDCLFEPLI